MGTGKCKVQRPLFHSSCTFRCQGVPPPRRPQPSCGLRPHFGGLPWPRFCSLFCLLSCPSSQTLSSRTPFLFRRETCLRSARPRPCGPRSASRRPGRWSTATARPPTSRRSPRTCSTRSTSTLGSRCTASSSPHHPRIPCPRWKELRGLGEFNHYPCACGHGHIHGHRKTFFPKKKLHHVFLWNCPSQGRRVSQLRVHRAGLGVPLVKGKNTKVIFSHSFSLILSLTMFFWQALHVGTHVGRPSWAPGDA